KTSGELEIVYVPREGGEPDGETCSYTMYDSREGKPRSAEYRLYFDSDALQENAKAGDILIIVRPTDGTNLRALVLPRESETGRIVAETLQAEGAELEDQFREIVAVIRAGDLAEILRAAGDNASVPDAASFLSHVAPRFIETSIAAGRLPSTRRMADEAVRAVRALSP